MGLFDKAFGKETGTVTLTKPEAYAAIAVAAVASDGDINQEEANRTVMDLATLRAFRRYDLRDLANTLQKVAGLIKKRGPSPVLQAAKAALTNEEVQAAFFVAADLICADGVVEEGEKKFLEDLTGTLQVDEGVALKIVEVVQVKNKA